MKDGFLKHTRRLLCSAAFILVIVVAGPSCRATEPALVVKVKDEINPHKLFSVFVLPEEEIDLEALQIEVTCEARADAGRLTAVRRNQWRYRAPATPGVTFLEISTAAAAQKMRLGVFVLIPFAQLDGEHLNEYRIGTYPEKALNGQSTYSAPSGFVEVTEANQHTYLSPHFQLKQFLCKQAGAFPKYVVLHERLLLALEVILQNVQQAGFRVKTLAVLSGYRTPFYNDIIENKTYSRHIYGDAADIFIDADGNDKMDDLDEDGDVDINDVKILYDLIDRLAGRKEFQPFTGGLGLYKKTSAHNGFVHIDTRGAKARW
jgi:hypothetical protein